MTLFNDASRNSWIHAFIQGIPYQATPKGARQLRNLHCWGKAKHAMANIWRQSRASLTQGPVRMEVL